MLLLKNSDITCFDIDVNEVAVYLFTKYPWMKSSTQYRDMDKSLVKAFPRLAFPGKRPCGPKRPSGSLHTQTQGPQRFAICILCYC